MAPVDPNDPVRADSGLDQAPSSAHSAAARVNRVVATPKISLRGGAPVVCVTSASASAAQASAGCMLQFARSLRQFGSVDVTLVRPNIPVFLILSLPRDGRLSHANLCGDDLLVGG